ncbi:MAG: two-component system, OmpR family, sensor histidine kinase KdpD, partial [Bryobacterales bacterium]|nr:two-component system, OmpR family, sensor histidine kinase KdpD [Bryobacterales bacterium]
MKKPAQSLVLSIPAGAVSWAIAATCFALHSNRSVASMALVLEVLAVAGLGDWLLAVLTSVSASLAFSWFFVDSVGSLNITSWEGAVTYSMLLTTALTGSHLAIRAQLRAAEAIRRREEMERLQQLGNVLLSSNGVAETAENVVKQVVQLFGVQGAVLRLEGSEAQFKAGRFTPERSSRLALGSRTSHSVLELHGPQPSPEVQSALANLIKLVLDRAQGAEQRARIEASQRGEELRNTVLNALAHNFRTPLTSIKAAASMLRSSSGLTNGPNRELAIVIDEEADRLDLLIRESLNLARIEARQENPRVEICSLASIVEAVHSRVRRYLGGRSFQADISDHLPFLQGDRFLFEQMLMQVVDNAWKYSKPDARIEITAHEEGGALIVIVRNEGPQIIEEERSKIFAKFYRGAASRSQVEGTGLGLAIAKAIAEAHGGRIWLDSEPG